MIVVKKVLKSKNYKMLVWVFFMLIVLASCSKDNEPEEVIYHQSYVKGKLNDTEISMNDINALVSSTKSDYNFIVRENEEKVSMFDWKVKLVDTPDSVVTLCLHLDNISRTNCMIASPNNDPTSVQTKDKCYITVENPRTENMANTGRLYRLFQLSTHFLQIEGNGKEGKVHIDLVFTSMAQP